jgi:hypothetical protein
MVALGQPIVSVTSVLMRQSDNGQLNSPQFLKTRFTFWKKKTLVPAYVKPGTTVTDVTSVE